MDVTEQRAGIPQSVKSVKDAGIVCQRLGNNLESYVLSNRQGMRVTILNYGATIAGIVVPDRNGTFADVTLGHDDLRNYVNGRYYFGATVGRFANRIAGGHFSLNGKEYHVTRNSKGNLLHGGTVGFDKKFWQARIAEDADGPTLELRLVSLDGDEGFPGTLEANVRYSVTENNELRIQYSAITGRPTVINLTNHGYFNLSGSAARSILDHELMIVADQFTPTDVQSIPTGTIEDVAGTPFDFRKQARIGDRIEDNHDQLKFAKGYDQNWVLNDYHGAVRKVATLYDPLTSRFMEVLTDQPGIQFYSGNYLDGLQRGKEGVPWRPRSGLCLECQHFPNSPNEQKFPSVVLNPGEVYSQTTIYRFSIAETNTLS
jgi:aldose 1-epimerase